MDEENAAAEEEARKQAQAASNDNINNIARSAPDKLENTYKNMYADYNRQTQHQNNKIIANANKQASQRAAIMGFNPAVGADYVSRSMGSAHDSVQSANYGLMDRQNELLGKQKTEHEQKQREFLDTLRNSNPDLAAKMQYNMNAGITGADYTGYMNADGSFKPVDEYDKTIAGKLPQFRVMFPDKTDEELRQMIIDNDINEYNRQQNEVKQNIIDRLTPTDVINNPKSFEGKSKETIEKWARNNDVTVAQNTDALSQIYNKGEGSLVVYQGKVYKYTKGKTWKYKKGLYDNRVYQITLQPLEGGEDIFLNRDRRAANW